ncbi:MAG: DsbA family protein, partial [Anaerolineae bacterium]
MTTRSRHRRRDSPEPWYKRVNPWLAGSVLLVLVVFGGLALFAALGPSSPPEPVDLVSLDDPAKGAADAPVTIVEFSDFQCPACGAFAATVLPTLEAAYVDTGQVRIIFRDFPLIQHEQAGLAAQAGACSHEQGLFWQMHDLIFARQTEWAGQTNAADLFRGYASLVGLDVDAFGACLDSGKYE